MQKVIDTWELPKLSFELSKCLGTWNLQAWDIPNLHHVDLILRKAAIPQSIRFIIRFIIRRTLQEHLWEATSKVESQAATCQKLPLGQIINTSFEVAQIELGNFSTWPHCFTRASKPKSCCWWHSCVDEGRWTPSIFNRHRYCLQWWRSLLDLSFCLQADGIANEFISSQCTVNIGYMILRIKLGMCRMTCHIENLKDLKARQAPAVWATVHVSLNSVLWNKNRRWFLLIHFRAQNKVPGTLENLVNLYFYPFSNVEQACDLNIFGSPEDHIQNGLIWWGNPTRPLLKKNTSSYLSHQLASAPGQWMSSKKFYNWQLQTHWQLQLEMRSSQHSPSRQRPVQASQISTCSALWWFVIIGL